MLRDYETMTMQLARAYFTRLDEGPEVLALPIELQLDLADRLLERPQRAADRRRLCAIGAQLSMLLGIATYDLGQPTPAQGWFDAAASAAARAGEPALGAEALASAAWAALGRSTRGLWEADDRQQTQADVWHAVGLLDRAETLAARDAIPWTQARLASLRAEASATLGDVAATEANLATAHRAIEQARPGQRRWGIVFFDAARLAFSEGLCELRLHRPVRAQAALRASIGLQGPCSFVNRSVAQLGLAIAHARHGEVEHACEIGAGVGPIPPTHRVTAIREHARDLRRELRPHLGLPAAHVLDERLTAIA